MGRPIKRLDKTQVEVLKLHREQKSAQEQIIQNYTDLADHFTRNNGFFKSLFLQILQNQQRLELKMLELEQTQITIK